MTVKRVVVTGLGTTSPVGGDVLHHLGGPGQGPVGRPSPRRRLGRGPAGPDRRPGRRRADRGARAGQGPPAGPLVPVRDGRRHGGVGRLRARRVRDVDHERLGVAMASGIGGVTTLLSNYDVLLEKGPRRVSPLAVPMLMPNAPAAQHQPVRRRAGGGEHAGVGLRVRQRGDRARRSTRSGSAAPTSSLAGGTEAAIHPLPMAAFANMMALSKNARRPDHGLAAVGHRPRRVRAR